MAPFVSAFGISLGSLRRSQFPINFLRQHTRICMWFKSARICSFHYGSAGLRLDIVSVCKPFYASLKGGSTDILIGSQLQKILWRDPIDILIFALWFFFAPCFQQGRIPSPTWTMGTNHAVPSVTEVVGKVGEIWGFIRSFGTRFKNGLYFPLPPSPPSISFFTSSSVSNCWLASLVWAAHLAWQE